MILLELIIAVLTVVALLKTRSIDTLLIGLVGLLPRHEAQVLGFPSGFL